MIRRLTPNFFKTLALACIGALAISGGASRAAFLTADGDFAGQGTPIGAPWAPVSGSENGASAGAQSPFTNAFANNLLGMNTVASANNPFIVGNTSSFPTLITSGMLYLNVDFRNNSADTGDYSLVVTQNSSGAARSVAGYVSGSSLTMEGIGGPFVTPIVQGTWYNLQLAMNVSAGTYTGTLKPDNGAAVAIPQLGFIANPGINCIYTDGGTSLVGGIAPNHDIDNFALSSTPVPEPASCLLFGLGAVGLVVAARRSRLALERTFKID